MSEVRWDPSKVSPYNALQYAACYDERRVAVIGKKIQAMELSIINSGPAVEPEPKNQGDNFTTIAIINDRGRASIKSLSCEGREISLPVGAVMVGRNPDCCAIYLDDMKVSRMHAVLTVHPSRAVKLRDLDSGNGTFVNGRRMVEIYLTVGDQITIGDIEFIVN